MSLFIAWNQTRGFEPGKLESRCVNLPEVSGISPKLQHVHFVPPKKGRGYPPFCRGFERTGRFFPPISGNSNTESFCARRENRARLSSRQAPSLAHGGFGSLARAGRWRRAISAVATEAPKRGSLFVGSLHLWLNRKQALCSNS